MRKVLKRLRKLEAAAYPPEYRQMQGIKTLEDLAEYCEGTPAIKIWDTGYTIVTEDEIVDLVSLKGMEFRQLAQLMEFYRQHFGSRRVVLDARKRTSYPLLRIAEKRGKLEIFRVEEWLWETEPFYEMEIRFL